MALSNTAGLNTTNRHRYRVDLSAEHAECESNYARLNTLLPQLAQASESVIGLPEQGETHYQARFTVLERSPYTTALELRIIADDELSGTSGFVPAQHFSLRMYHDACMAEVVGFQRRPRPAIRQSYPNARMFQPDEKWQWNRYLGEWLAYCQQHGYSTAVVSMNAVTEDPEA